MGFLRKSRKQGNLEQLRQGVSMLLGSQNMMIAKGMYEAKVQSEVVTADNLLNEAKPALEADIRAHYQRQIEKIKADIEKQANEQIDANCKKAEEHYCKEAKAYEQRARLDYDRHMRQPKAKLRREVIGDLMCMTAWVLRDYFQLDAAQLHEYILQMVRLQGMMDDSQAEGSTLTPITINDLVEQMRQEGYDLSEDIVLVEEMVDAEMERFKRPYVPAGSVMDKWTEGEDARLKRLVVEQGRDYPEISLILQRSENACKGRVRKLFGTSVLAKVREEAA